MSRRSYKGSSQATTLSAPINNTALTATVADGSTLPDGTSAPFVLTLDLGVTGEEKILCSSRTGNSLVISARGFDGTTATSHTSGASVRHTISAVDLDEANAHVNATTGIHGLTGSPVDTAGGSTITASGAAVRPLVVKGAASQTANLQEWQNSAGTALASITPNGGIVADGGAALKTTFITANAPSTVALAVNGAAAQTSNLQEWRDSAGAVLAAVSASGDMNAQGITASNVKATSNFQIMNRVTTARTGGAAAALPTNPVAYLQVADQDGNLRYIPAYS